MVQEQPLALIVDDKTSHLRLTEIMLVGLGFRTLAAEHAREALTLLQDHTPDLIVLDVHMPDMSGIDVAGRIRGVKRLQDVPVIFITSHKTEAVSQQARWEGVATILEKPLRGVDLERAVQDAVPSLSRPLEAAD